MGQTWYLQRRSDSHWKLFSLLPITHIPFLGCITGYGGWTLVEFGMETRNSPGGTCLVLPT